MLTERAVLDLIERVYEAAGQPQQWPVFLEKLGDAVGGTTTQMLIYDLESLEGNVAAIVRVDAERRLKYEQYYHQIDCWALNGNSVREGEVFTGEQLCSETILARSEFYNDFLRTMDHFHLLR